MFLQIYLLLVEYNKNILKKLTNVNLDNDYGQNRLGRLHLTIIFKTMLITIKPTKKNIFTIRKKFFFFVIQ